MSKDAILQWGRQYSYPCLVTQRKTGEVLRIDAGIQAWTRTIEQASEDTLSLITFRITYWEDHFVCSSKRKEHSTRVERTH